MQFYRNFLSAAMSVNLKYRTKLKNFGDKNANVIGSPKFSVSNYIIFQFERVYKNFRTEKLLLLCSDTTVKKEKVLLQSEENKISTDNAKEVLKKIEEWGVLKGLFLIINQNCEFFQKTKAGDC